MPSTKSEGISAGGPSLDRGGQDRMRRAFVWPLALLGVLGSGAIGAQPQAQGSTAKKEYSIILDEGGPIATSPGGPLNPLESPSNSARPTWGPPSGASLQIHHRKSQNSRPPPSVCFEFQPRPRSADKNAAEKSAAESVFLETLKRTPLPTELSHLGEELQPNARRCADAAALRQLATFGRLSSTCGGIFAGIRRHCLNQRSSPRS